MKKEELAGDQEEALKEKLFNVNQDLRIEKERYEGFRKALQMKDPNYCYNVNNPEEQQLIINYANSEALLLEEKQKIEDQLKGLSLKPNGDQEPENPKKDKKLDKILRQWIDYRNKKLKLKPSLSIEYIYKLFIKENKSIEKCSYRKLGTYSSKIHFKTLKKIQAVS
jgi:hypothetical protein